MTLLETQQQFARMVPRLVDKACELGYEVTLGDAYRDPRCPYGSEVSLHKKRLAIDLNIFGTANIFLQQRIIVLLENGGNLLEAHGVDDLTTEITIPCHSMEPSNG